MMTSTPPPRAGSTSRPITELLLELRGGGSDALERLFPLVYEELRQIAQRHLAREGVGHTLETSGLVHEAYLRLVDQTRAEWRDRHHFYALASRAMRHILVDYARRRRAAKRGGGWKRIDLDDCDATVEDRVETLLAVDAALSRLEEVDERLCRVVEYRFFGGLSEQEMAEALDVTERTIRRDWVKAKAWLYRELMA